MGESVGRDPEVAKAERALSDELAAVAEAEAEGNEELVEAFSSIGAAITGAVESGLASVGQGINDVRDELSDVGESIDEKMDEVVGFVVDPIRKGLVALGDELKTGLDPAMGVGFIVGAVIALKDDIWKGLKWLWENWDVVLAEGWDLILTGLKEGWKLLKTVAPYVLEGLVKLGDVILGALDMGWKFIKDTVVPGIVDGVTALGKLIWDYVPDWLQSGLKAVHSVVKTIGSLASDVGSFILEGLENLLGLLGLDTLAGAVGYLVDVLDALSDWLGIESKAQKAEEAAAAARGTTPESIEERGSPRAKAMFKEAKARGLGDYQAAGLAGLADSDAAAAEKAMEAFRGAVAAGNTAKQANAIAFEAFRLASTGGGAAAKPLGPTSDAGSVGDVVSEKAASIVAAKEANVILKKMVALAEKSAMEQARGRDTQDTLDTVSSSDVLSTFSTGIMAGGMSGGAGIA